jgi:predicted ester cyclase
MRENQLTEIYLAYIACLNSRDWKSLGQFIAEDVRYNDSIISLAGYREMLEDDFRAIPDLRFNIEIIIADKNHIACRLLFDCRPSGVLFGLPVNGQKVKFSENVIYKFHGTDIVSVWSVIDKAAIAAQLQT